MKVTSEEFRRLRDKMFQFGDRPLTGRELATLMDQVSADMRDSGGVSPYDLGAAGRLRGAPDKR